MQNPKLTLFILFLLCISCDPKINHQAIFGYWQADDDPKSLLKIDGQIMTFVYENDADAMTYTLADKCPATCNNTDNTCLVAQGEDGEACYAILKADHQKLALSYTSGTGQPLLFSKTKKFKIPTPYIIKNNRFMGIRPGDDIATHSQNLKKTVIESGEGSFDAYHILDNEGGILGAAYPMHNNKAKIDFLELTSTKVQTVDNIKIGTTFGTLSNVLEDFEVHGSEIEGRTTASTSTTQYLLDVYENQYDLKKSDIPTDTKVRAIILTQPNYSGQTLCFYGESQKVLKHHVELSFNGNIVSGYMVIQQPEYGTPIGTLQGKLVGNMIFAYWTVEIEGDHQVNEVVFKIDDDQLYQATGEMTDRKGKGVFKDIKQLKYTIHLEQIDCEDIAEVIGWAKEG